MQYTSTDTIFHFSECSELVKELGYVLIELQIVPQHGHVKISAVISCADSSKSIGVSDCSKVHHALAPKLVALLKKSEDEISMEVCSPGIERNIKDAHEFSMFIGKNVRVWDKTIGDWVSGVIKNADEIQVTLELQDSEEKSVSFENIAKAKFIHL